MNIIIQIKCLDKVKNQGDVEYRNHDNEYSIYYIMFKVIKIKLISVKYDESNIVELSIPLLSYSEKSKCNSENVSYIFERYQDQANKILKFCYEKCNNIRYRVFTEFYTVYKSLIKYVDYYLNNSGDIK